MVPELKVLHNFRESPQSHDLDVMGPSDLLDGADDQCALRGERWASCQENESGEEGLDATHRQSTAMDS
jgi:hypothetical protein